MKIPRPPGPRDRFFGLQLLRRMERDYLGFWNDAQRNYGDAVYMRIGPLDTYGFMHPDLIRAVLVDQARSFIRYERHMKVLGQLHGQSVLITEGEAWQQQRRMLQPGFSPKRFDGYARQMTEAAAGLLDSLPADGRTALDFEHVMNMLTMDVILRTMFGAKITQDTSDIEAAVRTLSRLGYEEMFDQVTLPDWLPLPGKAAKLAALRLLDELIWTHIRTRRAAPPDRQETQQDLLGMLLTAVDGEGDGSMLSDRQVRDQLMTIFLAGHETTASGLAWAGWLLAAHPDVARRAAEEVDRVLAGRDPVFADVAQLPYLGQVVKETLRLYPPAPGVFMRRAVEDARIGEWIVPKGALVSILATIPHRDPRWFPEPDKFDPSRFEAEAAKRIPRGAYFPFGTGPRVCIGNSFATMEMTLILAMLLQRYALHPAPGQNRPRIRMQVTLRPENGVRLELSRRERREGDAVPAEPPASHAGTCPFHAAGADAQRIHG
ncbi:MAG TPA: cytochrome P450 [Paucimonas sp.]|nr:cytochrome P450 [Paucimonas sp.]